MSFAIFPFKITRTAGNAGPTACVPKTYRISSCLKGRCDYSNFRENQKARYLPSADIVHFHFFIVLFHKIHQNIVYLVPVIRRNYTVINIDVIASDNRL